MNFLFHPWRTLRDAYARRMSWKLALSHLTVALLCQLVYLLGAAVAILIASGVFSSTDTSLPYGSGEMAEETRILATLLAGPVRDQSPAELAATLSRLPPERATGLGAFDGVLSPDNLLVVAAPDGTVLAESSGDIARGTPLWLLTPTALRDALLAALRNEGAYDPSTGLPPATPTRHATPTPSDTPADPGASDEPGAAIAPPFPGATGTITPPPRPRARATPRSRIKTPGGLVPIVQYGRDPELRVLVTAYPIVDGDGRIVGALALRSARVPESAPRSPLLILASVSALLLTLLAVVGIVSSGVSAIAGFVLARAFGRRLRRLESATEAIARGDLGARVAVRDLDEIGRVGARFNLLTERLDEADRARRAFVANISHELRTPLAIIRGHVEAQLARGASAPPAPEALEAIEREARALGGLIADFFTLARIEEAALPLQAAPVAVQEIAADAVAGIRPLASAQGHIAVHSALPPDLPLALADPTRLGQILGNLLYNALRHTPDGGVIIVEGAPTADGQAIEIAVTDTGTGIAPDDLPQIFDRFFQGERGGASDSRGGTGLGLAIVKQLVEAQGGAVRAESTPGEGTSIRFTLPRATTGR